MPASPSTLNYFIGKGTLKFTPTGGAQRDLGNAPEVEITPEIERLDHFSARAGTRSKDRSVVLEKTLTCRIVLDEITAENVGMLLLSNVVEHTDGTKEIDIFSLSEITGSLLFEGTNDVGNTCVVTMPSVSFGPSGSFSLISDEFGQVELTADVLLDTTTDGSTFGSIVFTDAA
jgi:hypothetical protein